MAEPGQSSRSPNCSCNSRNSSCEKFVGLVFRREFFQIIQPVADELRDGALPAQARIIGQVVRAFAPDKRGKKCQDRQGLHGEKIRLRDERSGFRDERSEIFLDGQNVLRRLVFRCGIAVRRQRRHRRRAGGVDDQRHGRLRQRMILAVGGVEKRECERRQFMHVGILRRNNLLKRFRALKTKLIAGLQIWSWADRF